MSKARWVLGLDGGGSKTALAYLSESGEVWGPVLGAGINPFDQPGWDLELGALARGCPPPGPLAHVTLGLPGYGENPGVSAHQETVAAGLWPGVPLSLVNDARVAFEGAFAGGPGLLLLAGTGSMVWGSDGERHRRVGGFGAGFGDEGSAYWIGVRALGLCSQVLDGRLSDRAFAGGILRATGEGAFGEETSTPGALLGWYAGQAHLRSAVAGLARTVDALAEAGNPTAADLLAQAAAELAVHLLAARTELAGGAALPWSTAGGVFASRSVLAGVTGWVGRPPRPPRFSPLGGALLHAARQADFAVESAPLVQALRDLSPRDRSAT